MSEEPVRLRDDPSAPAELRADLTRAAGAPARDYDVGEGLARFSAAVGALPAAGAATKAVTGIAGAKAGILSSGVFWGLAAGAVGASVILFAPNDPEPAPPSPTALVVAPAPVSAAPPEVEPAPSVAPIETAAPIEKAPGEVASARPITEAAAPARTAAPITGAPDPLGGPSTDALNDEVRDLAALRAEGDPARALALAASGAQRFPQGVFGLEREAIAIGALARLGRTAEAKARASAFLAAHPKSVYAEQVRRAGGL